MSEKIVIQSPYGEIEIEELEEVKIDLDYLEFECFDNYDKQVALLIFSVLKNKVPDNFSFLSYLGDLTIWCGKVNVSKHKIITPVKEVIAIF
jgi:hypothetical protein